MSIRLVSSQTELLFQAALDLSIDISCYYVQVSRKLLHCHIGIIIVNIQGIYELYCIIDMGHICTMDECMYLLY